LFLFSFLPVFLLFHEVYQNEPQNEVAGTEHQPLEGAHFGLSFDDEGEK
jgi:hypothetical protein